MIYALVDAVSLIVNNVTEISQEAIDAGFDLGPTILIIQSDTAVVGDIYNPENGSFTAPPPPQIPPERLALEARGMRDSLLRNIYDVGISMAQRALRLAVTDADKTYANGKISELDAYAEALQGVPEQAGFPQTIDWPIAPTK